MTPTQQQNNKLEQSAVFMQVKIQIQRIQDKKSMNDSNQRHNLAVKSQLPVARYGADG
jgi:hypothetical protein